MRALFSLTLPIVILGALAAPARCDTQVGIQAFVLSGKHTEPKVSISGAGAGALFQVDQRWQSMELHLEGIPTVATATVNFQDGPATANIGVFDATLRFKVDKLGRLWLGAGSQIYAQQTPVVSLNQVNASRLAGSRYEIITRLPLRSNRFVEAQLAGMPHLSGIVYQTTTFSSQFRTVASAPETASMIDLTAAYGIRHGKTEYLFGVRSINFTATFPSGREADRNVGAGLTAEVRLSL
jgi:hypothetical protein